MRRFYQKILLGWSLGHSNTQNTAGHTAISPFPNAFEPTRRERKRAPREGLMGDATDLADRVKQLEIQVAELQKAIEVLLHNPNWREVISLSPSEIEQWARAIKDRR